ncbi:MAG: SMP-30/gluconolactonase/LRE family protein [Thermomicrobiales bacterium]
MTDWTWEQLAGPATITEGPAWDAPNARLLFTSIDDNEVRAFDPATGEITTLYTGTGGTNGLTYGRDGLLYGCAGTARQVVRWDRDGAMSVLADRFEGNRLNSPNDLVVDSSGRVWFTDPRYGEDHSDRELDHDSVYRLTPPPGGEGAWTIERLTFDTTRPNGILLSPDERTLFVAQSNHDPDEPRQLRAYPVLEDGTLGPYTVLHDFGAWRGIDGMRFNQRGQIVATCGSIKGGPGPRIAVFALDGTVLEEHPVPAGDPTNCALSPDWSTLYVTTLDGRLYRATGLQG